MAEQFPPEIIYTILSRLPIKSLARFRCVCKPWLKYINDPYLQTIHVQEEPTPIMFQKSPYFNHMKQCEISFFASSPRYYDSEKGPRFGFLFYGFVPQDPGSRFMQWANPGLL
ncbi:putative F-box domain-containing protein [Helianthus annuus]|nr:putative F-box domain-containing protein [Helianthus annuus]